MLILLWMTWDSSTWLPLKVLSGLGQMSLSTRKWKQASLRYISLIQNDFIWYWIDSNLLVQKVLIFIWNFPFFFSSQISTLLLIPCFLLCEDMYVIGVESLPSHFSPFFDLKRVFPPICQSYICLFVWQVAATSVQVLNAVNSKLPFLVTTADDAKDSLKEEIRLR